MAWRPTASILQDMHAKGRSPQSIADTKRVLEKVDQTLGLVPYWDAERQEMIYPTPEGRA